MGTQVDTVDMEEDTVGNMDPQTAQLSLAIQQIVLESRDLTVQTRLLSGYS